MKLVLKIFVVAAVLFMLSSFVTRETSGVVLYQNETGGGVAYPDVRAGFPLNYIHNPGPTVDSSIIWLNLVLDGVFWIGISYASIMFYRKFKDENIRD